MAPRTVLITGANRGIGLGLTKSFLDVEGVEVVIAGCRNLEKAEDLLRIKNPKLHIVQLDITDDASIEKAVDAVEKIVGERGLNMLINNAGVIVRYILNQKPSRADVARQYDINVTSTVILTQYFLDLIRKAPNDRRIINISSGAGSVSRNVIGSAGKLALLVYSTSKSAVNQFTKSLSIDLAEDNIIAAAFCPGWVKTELGGPDAEITIDQSMADLVPSILKVSKEHNGGYFERTLEVIKY